MRWLVLACLLLGGAPAGARAGDFALCAQSADAELKFTGCSGLVAHDPGLAVAYSSRGLALVAMGETDRAIADYSFAISLDPGLLVAYYNRGLSYLDVEEPVLAEQDFAVLIERNPGDATAYSGRALAFAAQGKFDEAESDFTRAVALDPNYVRAYVGRGNLLLSRRMFDAARHDFDRALRLDPGNPDAVLGRSYAVTASLPGDPEDVGSTSALPVETEPVAIPRLPNPPAKSLTPKGLRPFKGALGKSSKAVRAAGMKLERIVALRPFRGRAPSLSLEKPLYDPSLTERSCNNFQGEPCLVFSR